MKQFIPSVFYPYISGIVLICVYYHSLIIPESIIGAGPMIIEHVITYVVHNI